MSNCSVKGLGWVVEIFPSLVERHVAEITSYLTVVYDSDILKLK
jgi:hypothetical protein